MSHEELIELFERIKMTCLSKRDDYLIAKASGAYFEWDDGTNIDDAINREDDAVKNLDRNILRLKGQIANRP